MKMSYAEFLHSCETHSEAKKMFLALGAKRYWTPPGYENPKNFCAKLTHHSTWLLSEVQSSRGEITDQMADSVVMWRMYEILKRRGVPTFFLARDFGAAIAGSTLNDHLLVRDIKFPASAAIVCIPDDLDLQLSGASVKFVAFSWATKAELEQITGEPASAKFGVLSLVIDYASPSGKNMSLNYDCEGDIDLSELLKPRDSISMDSGGQLAMGEIKQSPSKFSHRLIKFAIQIILGMSALPQFIDTPALARPAKIKNGKKIKDEIWGPVWIGFKYKRPPKPIVGTHASPRMHRKNGCWKQQPYGPSNSLRKSIWVDEYWVCVPEDEQPKK